MQRAVMDNKRRQGFNLTDVPLELCLLQGEIAELFEAWRLRSDEVGDELADVALYVFGLAGILSIDLADCVEGKLAVNARRRYQRRPDGVLVRVEDGDDR